MRRADIEVPNHAVDMDSWARSACYPRGTFYPLSDHAPTCHGRITSSCFRTCSTRRSHSQAPLYTCTRHLITNQAEGTFERLRYAFGGDHPSQTTHQSMSPHPRVRIQTNKGSYFNSGSTNTGVPASKPPTYPTHHVPRFNDKL